MLGIYDSGIGGFTVYSKLLQVSDLPVQYLADTEILPLGDKSPEFIRQRVALACSFLFNQGVNLIVLACNTATVNSIRYLQQTWLPENFPHKQILGISKPFTELLSQEYGQYKSASGLIFSTPATHKSQFYNIEFAKVGFEKLISVSCQNLASLIESEDRLEITKLLKKISAQTPFSPKTILLACTHYPLVKDLISEVFSESLIIDPSQFIVQKLLEYIQKHPEYAVSKGKTKFWTTSNSPDFDKKINGLFQTKLISCSASL